MKMSLKLPNLPYLFISALEFPRASTGGKDTKAFITVVATVSPMVAHQRVRHALHAIRARK